MFVHDPPGDLASMRGVCENPEGACWARALEHLHAFLIFSSAQWCAPVHGDLVFQTNNRNHLTGVF